jgi:hypothetical protein
MVNSLMRVQCFSTIENFALSTSYAIFKIHTEGTVQTSQLDGFFERVRSIFQDIGRNFQEITHYDIVYYCYNIFYFLEDYSVLRSKQDNIQT